MKDTLKTVGDEAREELNDEELIRLINTLTALYFYDRSPEVLGPTELQRKSSSGIFLIVKGQELMVKNKQHNNLEQIIQFWLKPFLLKNLDILRELKAIKSEEQLILYFEDLSKRQTAKHNSEVKLAKGAKVAKFPACPQENGEYDHIKHMALCVARENPDFKLPSAVLSEIWYLNILHIFLALSDQVDQLSTTVNPNSFTFNSTNFVTRSKW